MSVPTKPADTILEKMGVTEDDFRLLIGNVRDYAIILLDPGGRVATWTKAAELIKGYRPEEIIGKHFSTLYPREDVEAGKPQRELKTAAEEGRFEDEGWRVRKDGSRFWANVVVTPLRDESGALRGFGKITRDLTERKKAEEELRRMRDELEERVKQRTAELARSNDALKAELSGRKQAEEAIRSLSTPVLPVRDRLLILPLIGVVDSNRALQLTEQLLSSIRTFRAKSVVVDITGVPIVDSRVANHLLQTVEAARLMGASVIVTGISPEIAQTLVRIGIDLSRLVTRTDLMGGLEEAEKLLGYQVIRAKDPGDPGHVGP
jgi:PAS domain S-box-containing protein